MALTPEDVVNKRFQHVKFRDGYDQDEVDDFLDEVVVELRRLYQENDDLKKKLSTAEQRIKELESNGGSAAQADDDPQATQAMPAAVPHQAPEFGGRGFGQPQSEENDAPQQGTAPSPLVAPQAPSAQAPAPQAPAPQSPAPQSPAPQAPAGQSPLGEQQTGSAPGGAASALQAGGNQDAHGLISLAQRLHDEHVAEGERKRDQLIKDAESRASDIVTEAERKRESTLSSLESEKKSLEREIDGLQNFERQYRTRLKSYLTDQLRDLENSGSLAPETLDPSKAGNAKHSL